MNVLYQLTVIIKKLAGMKKIPWKQTVHFLVDCISFSCKRVGIERWLMLLNPLRGSERLGSLHQVIFSFCKDL